MEILSLCCHIVIGEARVSHFQFFHYLCLGRHPDQQSLRLEESLPNVASTCLRQSLSSKLFSKDCNDVYLAKIRSWARWTNRSRHRTPCIWTPTPARIRRGHYQKLEFLWGLPSTWSDMLFSSLCLVFQICSRQSWTQVILGLRLAQPRSPKAGLMRPGDHKTNIEASRAKPQQLFAIANPISI